MGSSFDRHSTNVTRRALLVHGPMAVAGLAAFRGLALAQAGGTGFAEVKTTRGRVRGARGSGLTTFKGIPYAGSVTGANRFKAAPPVAAWTGVRDALQLAAPAPQPGRPASAANRRPPKTVSSSTSGRRGPMDANGQ